MNVKYMEYMNMIEKLSEIFKNSIIDFEEDIRLLEKIIRRELFKGVNQLRTN
jgi:hypothetical protein